MGRRGRGREIRHGGLWPLRLGAGGGGGGRAAPGGVGSVRRTHARRQRGREVGQAPDDFVEARVGIDPLLAHALLNPLRRTRWADRAATRTFAWLRHGGAARSDRRGRRRLVALDRGGGVVRAQLSQFETARFAPRAQEDRFLAGIEIGHAQAVPLLLQAHPAPVGLPWCLQKHPHFVANRKKTTKLIALQLRAGRLRRLLRDRRRPPRRQEGRTLRERAATLRKLRPQKRTTEKREKGGEQLWAQANHEREDRAAERKVQISSQGGRENRPRGRELRPKRDFSGASPSISPQSRRIGSKSEEGACSAGIRCRSHRSIGASHRGLDANDRKRDQGRVRAQPAKPSGCAWCHFQADSTIERMSL